MAATGRLPQTPVGFARGMKDCWGPLGAPPLDDGKKRQLATTNIEERRVRDECELILSSVIKG